MKFSRTWKAKKEPEVVYTLKTTDPITFSLSTPVYGKKATLSSASGTFAGLFSSSAYPFTIGLSHPGLGDVVHFEHGPDRVVDEWAVVVGLPEHDLYPMLVCHANGAMKAGRFHLPEGARGFHMEASCPWHTRHGVPPT